VIERDIPLETVRLEKAMEYAMENGSHVLNLQQMKLESESNVARIKALTGLQADLYMQLGLGQTGPDIATSYKNPRDQQIVEIGISLPILDWGYRKGQVQVAKSRRDMVLTQIEQAQNNFEMNVARLVKQFNLQSNRLNVASKTDYTAERRNEIARRLYLLEKSTILDLNAAITEKDLAKRNYISSLADYWLQYYTLRSITLYDFEKNIPITEDYETLIK
jgi:outer membrane protein TolC